MVQNDRPLALHLLRTSGLATAWTISPCLSVHSQNGVAPQFRSWTSKSQRSPAGIVSTSPLNRSTPRLSAVLSLRCRYLASGCTGSRCGWCPCRYLVVRSGGRLSQWPRPPSWPADAAVGRIVAASTASPVRTSRSFTLPPLADGFPPACTSFGDDPGAVCAQNHLPK